LQTFLGELGIEEKPTCISVDNTSTINLANNPVVHKRTNILTLDIIILESWSSRVS